MRELVNVSEINNECFASKHHQMQEIYNCFRSKHGNVTMSKVKNGKHESNKMIAKSIILLDKQTCCIVLTRNNSCEFRTHDSVNLQKVH